MFQVMTGFLVPLERNLTANCSAAKIPIYEGYNVVGRSNLTVFDKRVSRQHISLQTSFDGSTEIVVVCMLFIFYIDNKNHYLLWSYYY